MIDNNRVYQKVLTLINKDNRGYLTPDEYNYMAHQAVTEIFEAYPVDMSRAAQTPPTNSDYSDLPRNIEEKITYFDNVATIDTKTTLVGTVEGFAYPDDFYRLGIISVDGRMADEVHHGKLTYINLSPLTAPTETQPVYTRHENGVVVYPSSVDEINFVYLREPGVPNWTYVQDTDNTYIVNKDDDDYADFDLHPSEEQELVAKILSYAGVIIREPDITNVGIQKESQLKQTEV